MAVESQGKGSVLATKAFEAQGKGGGNAGQRQRLGPLTCRARRVSFISSCRPQHNAIVREICATPVRHEQPFDTQGAYRYGYSATHSASYALMLPHLLVTPH